MNLPLRPLATGWVVHHPIFAHFVGVKPAAIYRDLVNQVRGLFDGELVRQGEPSPSRTRDWPGSMT